MAFVSIGLNLAAESGNYGWRPSSGRFLGARAFNLLVTLAAAYVFFGGFRFAP